MNCTRSTVIIYMALMLAASVMLGATEPTNSHSTENAVVTGETSPPMSSAIQFAIQWYNQKIYYQGDGISVKATITNESPNAFRFRLADNRLFSLSFDVRDLANMAIRPSERYTTVLSENKPVFARDITILPGENFSFVEELGSYRELPAGVFVVSANFYPELLGQSGQSILQSNNLTLSVRPSVRRQNMVEEKVNENVQQILKAENLPPDQVVGYILSARQRNQREAYFLYLDIETLFKNEPRRGESLRRMSEADHMETIRAFRDALWKSSTVDPISLVPSSWEIMRTSYNGTRGTVEATLKFRNNFFTEVKEYRYQLEKQQDIWKIVSYSVTNKGNE